jgi:carboxylesterase
VSAAAPSPPDAPGATAASAAPFELAGGPDAVLLLHGLTGSPYEMRHVAEECHRRGSRCVGPLMPGHGGDPRALLGLGWREWIEGARRELRRLDTARRVVVVGCSMGALVACALAHSERQRIDGIALLAPALHLTAAARLAAFLSRRTPLGRFWQVVRKAGGSDVRDPVQRRDNPSMPGVPLPAVAELLDLGRHVDGLLPEITAPALIVAARHDHTVKLSGARRIAERIGSAPARLVVLERSFHLVGIDVERDRCAGEVATFVDTIAARPDGGAHGGASWRRT